MGRLEASLTTEVPRAGRGGFEGPVLGYPCISKSPQLPRVETGGKETSHATGAKASHRGVEVHTGDAATSSFKSLVGLQATWGNQGKI